jgi:DNA-binding transcriptional MocR family regulator
MESLMPTNLQTQLSTLAKKQQAHNTELIQKELRKLAFDKASSGYMHMLYNVDIPFDSKMLTQHFNEQGVVCSVRAHSQQSEIYIAWGSYESQTA